MVAPSRLRLSIAASSGVAGVLIGVETVGSASNTLDDIDAADGEGVRVPNTFAPSAASGGSSHAFA